VHAVDLFAEAIGRELCDSLRSMIHATDSVQNPDLVSRSHSAIGAAITFESRDLDVLDFPGVRAIPAILDSA